jgi:transposase
MIGFGSATRVYLAAGATDMRKGFDGLFGIARDRLGMDPLSGHLFVFCNGRRNRLKVLYWDGSGLWICSKRLEKGRFSWPVQGDEQDFGELSRAGRVRMSSEELTLLVSGIELSQSRRKDWYRKEIVEAGAEKPVD